MTKHRDVRIDSKGLKRVECNRGCEDLVVLCFIRPGEGPPYSKQYVLPKSSYKVSKTEKQLCMSSHACKPPSNHYCICVCVCVCVRPAANPLRNSRSHDCRDAGAYKGQRWAGRWGRLFSLLAFYYYYYYYAFWRRILSYIQVIIIIIVVGVGVCGPTHFVRMITVCPAHVLSGPRACRMPSF